MLQTCMYILFASEQATYLFRKNEQKFIDERDAVILSTGKEKEANAQAWANVATLIDFKAPVVGRDTTRMKKLLIDLKH